jgi:hypothetical protein
MKKNLYTFLISLVLVAVSETIINQIFLKDSYGKLTELWRTPEELTNYAPIFLGIYIVFSLSFTYIFHLSKENMNWKKGLQLGLALGIFSRFWYAYTNLIVLPIPAELAFGWFSFGLIEVGIIGCICGYFFPKKSVS